jgi:hypothetical protein
VAHLALPLEHGDVERGVVDGIDAIAARRRKLDVNAAHPQRDCFALLRGGQAEIDDAALQLEGLGAEVELAEAAGAARTEAESVRADAHFGAAIVGRQPGADRDHVVDLRAIPLAAAVFLGAPDAHVTFDGGDAPGDQGWHVRGGNGGAGARGICGGSAAADEDGSHQTKPAAHLGLLCSPGHRAGRMPV